MKIKVKFEDPEFGSIWLKIKLEDQEIHIWASYSPRNSLLDLVETLKGLLEIPMDSAVIWNEEPSQYEMKFSRAQKQISLIINYYPSSSLSIYKSEEILTLTGSYEDICIPFWKGLRDLQGRFTEEELTKRWGREFPYPKLDELTNAIRKRKM